MLSLVITEEEGKSQVSAYWEDGEQLTATIQMTDDTYYIEVRLHQL